jgi:hypothetical protein
MEGKIKLRYRVGNSPTDFLKAVHRGLTVRQLSDVVASAAGEPLNQVAVDGAILSPAGNFDEYYESLDQTFVFSSDEPIRPPPTSCTDSDGPREMDAVKDAVMHGQ